MGTDGIKHGCIGKQDNSLGDHLDMYIVIFNIYLYFVFSMFFYSNVYYQMIFINHIPHDLCMNIRSVCVLDCLCVRRRCSQHLAEQPWHVR